MRSDSAGPFKVTVTKSSEAFETLEEARTAATDLVSASYGGEAIMEAPEQIKAAMLLPDKGASIGPLPGGETIEVEATTWRVLCEATGHRAPENSDDRAAILAAYNQRHAGQGGGDVKLSIPMRDLLWTVAQHKYGWTHVSNSHRSCRTLQVAGALERRGLVAVDRERHHPTCSATDAGRDLIAELFPVSPFILGTYDWRAVRETHGEWTPRAGQGASA